LITKIMWRLFNMKKYIGLFIILICLTSTAFYEALAINQGDGKGKGDQTKYLPKTAADPSSTVLNINNITSWITADGFMPAIVNGSWNGSFPKGVAAGFIYQEGIVWGGQVNDGGTPTLRVGGNTYFPGTTRLTRIVRVRPDWKTADLTDDAANFFLESSSDVTAGQIDQIRAQYQKDWNEWPAQLGAPYENRDGVPGYQPDPQGRTDDPTDTSKHFDIPGIPGASQTIWLSYNDVSAASAYGSPPIGIKVNEVLWAYAISNPLGNVIFKKVDLIYQGLNGTPANSTIDSMYIVQWADPDVGNSTDDFAGCDTTLGLGYCYNSTYNDAIYKSIGSAPPAGGYDFLQGVAQYTGNPADSAIHNLQWVHGYKAVNRVPMSTFVYFAAGGAWSDPTGQQYVGTQQWYSLMRGYQPDAYPLSDPFPTNVTGVTVGGNGTYLLPGDPVTHTGWVDGEVEGAGDRRICLVTGPFTMTRGDTAEIVSALVGGIGADNLSSITVLKFYDNFAQYAYDQLFNLPNIPPPTVAAQPIDGGVILNWDNAKNVISIEQADHKGYNFEGYIVYQLPSSTTDLSNAKRIATYDIADNVTTVFDQQLDISTGAIISKPVVFGTDAGVKRFITIKNDIIRGNVPMVNGTNYYFAVTAYGYNPDPSVPFHILESSPVPLTVVPQIPNPGVKVPGSQGDLAVKHNGVGNGTVTAVVVDPNLTNGHVYKVGTFVQTYYNDASGNWHMLNNVSKKSNKLAPNGTADVSPSTMSFAAVYGQAGGSLDIIGALDLVSPDYDFVDGIKLTLPTNVTINSAEDVTDCYSGSRPNNTEKAVIDNVAHTITWGSQDTTGFGCFSGSATGQRLKFNVTAALPFTINWLVWDDGYGQLAGSGTLVNATGSSTIDSAGSQIVNQYQWNVTDSTLSKVLLDHQTIFGGVDIYAGVIPGPGGSTKGLGSNVGTYAGQIVDGIQYNMSANFSAPTNIGDVLLNGAALSVSNGGVGDPAAHYKDAGGHWDITDFEYFGYDPATVKATLGPAGYAPGAGGSTDVSELSQDYEFRWTGVLADTTIGAVTIQYTQSGGQMATIIGASGYHIADHPLNPSPGSPTPFAVRVPFEVWNIDTNQQINLLFWDRSGNPTASGGKVWNTDNRVYTWTVNTPYVTTAISPLSSDVTNHGTWNTVWYASKFTTGDVIKIVYPNPVIPGVDNWTLTAPAAPSYSNAQAVNDVNMINVFPNPYYGFNSRELTRSQKYVTFSHLPAQATIRIFDLAGKQVRVINKNDPSQFSNWDLNNQNSYPVASGVYVVYIDMPGIGATKILKLAVVQEQQILNVY
jgi:hypothetical protein